MPAYLATVDSEEGATGSVYFVKNAITARRLVTAEFHDGELGGATVRRMPHFDRYEEQNWVPMQDMVYEGWWGECYNCGVRITDSEQLDEDDNEFVLDVSKVVGSFHGCHCCSQKCMDLWKETVAIREETRYRAKEDILDYIHREFGGIKATLDTEYIIVYGEKHKGYVGSIRASFLIPDSTDARLTVERSQKTAKDDATYELFYRMSHEELVDDFLWKTQGIHLTHRSL